MVFNVFRDTIHFVLWLVDFYLRVGAGDSIDLPTLLLLLEDGALTNTYR
jgi:hypothetical protein